MAGNVRPRVGVLVMARWERRASPASHESLLEQMQPEIVPLAERVQPIEDMPMTLHPSVTAAAGRVLIVEDEWILAASAEAALEEAHCTIVGIAVTADDAVRLAEAERPDLVLMDIRLRGPRNGIDAARDQQNRVAGAGERRNTC